MRQIEEILGNIGYDFSEGFNNKVMQRIYLKQMLDKSINWTIYKVAIASIIIMTISLGYSFFDDQSQVFGQSSFVIDNYSDLFLTFID